MIILLHGMGQDGAAIDQATDLPARGTAAGVIVAAPDATGDPALWRAGGQGPDADFLDALITDVEARHCVDTARVGIVGFSVGGLFAVAYGCAHQDRIAAIVTAELDAPGSCTRPMPILAFHATGDPVVAYAPPPGVTPLGGGAGTEANMAKWATISHCAPTPETTDIGSDVTKLEWPRCSDGSQVILYKVAGGAHSWPATHQINAADLTVSFLRRHPLHQ